MPAQSFPSEWEVYFIPKVALACVRDLTYIFHEVKAKCKKSTLTEPFLGDFVTDFQMLKKGPNPTCVLSSY